MSTGRAIGAVREIHRHPVKSMGGESIRETLIEKRFGVVGDRAWAIRDLSAGEIRGAIGAGLEEDILRAGLAQLLDALCEALFRHHADP